MNLYWILKSIKKNKARNIAFIIQLVIGSFIMLLSLGLTEFYISTENRSLEILPPNLYRVEIVDKSDASSLIAPEDYNPDDIYLVQKYYLLLKNDKRVAMIGKGIIGGMGFLEETRANPEIIKCSNNSINIHSYDKEMTDMYNFKVKKGISFSEYYKSDFFDENVIPMLVTETVEKENPLGSLVKIPVYTDKYYKIIGVLDSNYPTFEFLGNPIESNRLDDNFLCITGDLYESNYPYLYIKLKDGENINELKKDLDLKVESKKEFQFEELKEKVDNLSYDISYSKRSLYYGVIILILSSFGIISTILSSILDRKKEFGVRISLGATKKNIENIIFGEVILLFIISQSISFLLFLFISNVNKSVIINLKIISISMGITFSLCAFSLILVFMSIFKMKPIELIHERK